MCKDALERKAVDDCSLWKTPVPVCSLLNEVDIWMGDQIQVTKSTASDIEIDL